MLLPLAAVFAARVCFTISSSAVCLFYAVCCIAFYVYVCRGWGECTLHINVLSNCQKAAVVRNICYRLGLSKDESSLLMWSVIYLVIIYSWACFIFTDSVELTWVFECVHSTLTMYWSFGWACSVDTECTWLVLYAYLGLVFAQHLLLF